MSPRAHSVLATAMTGEYTQGEVARAVGLDKTTMVVTLDELEAAGLAERRPSPGDRRVRVIAVTPAGRRKVREAEAIMDRVREDVLSSLSADDRRRVPAGSGHAGMRSALRAGGVRARRPPAGVRPTLLEAKAPSAHIARRSADVRRRGVVDPQLV